MTEAFARWVARVCSARASFSPLLSDLSGTSEGGAARHAASVDTSCKKEWQARSVGRYGEKFATSVFLRYSRVYHACVYVLSLCAVGVCTQVWGCSLVFQVPQPSPLFLYSHFGLDPQYVSLESTQLRWSLVPCYHALPPPILMPGRTGLCCCDSSCG